MTRDDGWRLLSIGRNIERLGFYAAALSCAFETGTINEEGGFEAVISLFDSTITFHAQYQQRRDVAALLSEDASFLLMNAYAARVSGAALSGLLAQELDGRSGVIDWGELSLVEDKGDRQIGLSFFARWSSEG